MSLRLWTTLFSFFLLIVIAIMGLDRLLTTEQGLLFAFNIAQKFIPGQLQINSLHGTLNTSINLEGLHYKDTDQDISIKQAKISWQPNMLLQGKLALKTLYIDNLIYRDLNPNKKSSLPDLKLLRKLSVDDLKLNNINIQPINIKLNINGALTPQWNLRWQAQKDKISLTGTLQGPFPALNMQTRIPHFAIPDFGLHLKDIVINAQTDLTHKIHWQGQIHSGTGVLQITGTTQFAPQLITTLKLQGQNVLAMDTSEYHIIASPELILTLDAQKLDLTGNVFIPKALFKIGAAETHALALSKDVVFVNNKKTVEPTLQLPLYARITLTLGDDINLYYQNLKTKLNGSLQLIDQPSRPTLATGQINLVNGEYIYYGQKLTISNDSHINYAGNAIDNPNLNIQATRAVMALPSSAPQSNTVTTSQAQLAASTLLFNQPTQVTVGVNVQGTAQNPVISLFADPSILSQVDTLSYLVTGQAANQLNASAAQLLFTAANGLNPGQGKLDSLMNQLQKTTGLTTLSIESTNIVNPTTNSLVQNTSLVLGKTLTPKLYITYSVGLLQPINILQLNYILNKYLTLQTSSSTFANGVDLLYKIERE